MTGRRASGGGDHLANAQLWKAIGSRDRTAMDKAVSKGASVRATGQNTLHGRETMLQRAAELADDVAVAFLLERGAPQAHGRYGRTPLIALAQGLTGRDQGTDETRALRCLDLLLARRPNVFAVDNEKNATALFHLLISDSPVAPALQRRMVSHFQKSRLKWPPGEACTLLRGAYNFGTVELFEGLIASGADLQEIGRAAAGLPYRLLTGFETRAGRFAYDPLEKEQWWEAFARHNAPGGTGGPGVLADQQEAAQAEVARRRAAHRQHRLDTAMAIPGAHPSPRRLRF